MINIFYITYKSWTTTSKWNTVLRARQ